MNTKLLSFVCALLVVFTANATVRTVANFPASSATYSDVASAITAASNGDTIYVNGSPYAYNSSQTIILTKRLVFVGTGYADSAEGSLNSIIAATLVIDTLAGVSGASNCQFLGISFTGNIESGQRYASDGFQPKNLFFSGCYFGFGFYVENDGWVFQDCMFYNGCTWELYIDYSPVNSCIIENNYFSLAYCNGYAIGFNVNPTVATGLVVDHNFFEQAFGADVCQYAIITNNVFFAANAIGSTNLQNCQISNNLFFATGKDSLTSNESGLTGNTVHNNYVTYGTNYQFVGNTLTAQQSYPGLLSDHWQLLNTSLGHNAATEGTDCGPFGGTYPTNLNGSPIFPQMFQLNLSTLVPFGNPVKDSLQVQFEARQQKQ